MAARMQAMGHQQVYFYEIRKGGTMLLQTNNKQHLSAHGERVYVVSFEVRERRNIIPHSMKLFLLRNGTRGQDAP